MQISINVMLKRDFGGNTSIYKNVTIIYYPSWSWLSASEDYTVHVQYSRFHFLLWDL